VETSNRLLGKSFVVLFKASASPALAFLVRMNRGLSQETGTFFNLFGPARFRHA